jgi:glycosyltransferase involved in cell wall biosynthesis
MPLISIIMPAWNASRYIGEALQSILSQSRSDFEIIVVDDRSTDDTRQIVEEAASRDSRIRVLDGAHSGVAQARNLALTAAAGAFISFLDADDLWPAGRLGRHMRLLEENPDASGIAGEILVFEKLGGDQRPLPGSAHTTLLSIYLGAATFRRAAFARLGNFDESMLFAEDVDFFFRFHEAGLRFAIDRDLALLHRRHDTNMTHDRASGRKYMLAALGKSMVRRRAPGYVPPPHRFALQTPPEDLGPWFSLIKPPARVVTGTAGE